MRITKKNYLFILNNPAYYYLEVLENLLKFIKYNNINTTQYQIIRLKKFILIKKKYLEPIKIAPKKSKSVKKMPVLYPFLINTDLDKFYCV